MTSHFNSLPSKKRIAISLLYATLAHVVVAILFMLLAVSSPRLSQEGVIHIEATQSTPSNDDLVVLVPTATEVLLDRPPDSRREVLSLRVDTWIAQEPGLQIGGEFANAHTDAESNGDGMASAGGGGGQGVGGFFGIRPTGKHLVLVLDGSGSMSNYGRFAELRREVNSVLSEMPHTTLVNIIVFSKRNESRYFCRTYETCTKDVYERANKWLGDIVPHGPTEPERALRRAFMLEPDDVLFLSDGGFREIAVRGQLRYRAAHTRLHTINFHGEEVAILSEMAHATGGEYRFVPQRLE